MKRNKTDVQDSDISTVLSNLGFKDITEEWPIRFIDCLPYSFSDIFEVHSRWIRESQDDIFSEVLVGLNSNGKFIDIIVSSVYSGCKSKAYQHIYYMRYKWEDSLKRFISSNEQYVMWLALEASEKMYKFE